MAKTVKKCLQLALKTVNSTMGILGIAMILYGIWMLRVWPQDMTGNSSSDDDDSSTFPWFIHAFLGLGIALCAITCLGHFAADTANDCCLGCYSAIIFLLILLDSLLIADVLLNPDWEKDLPDDPSGRFQDLKDFVDSNILVSQWVALLIFLAQGFSILIATVIRTLGSDERNSYNDSDQAYDEPPRIPLLNQPPAQVFSHYVVGEPQLFYNNEDWKVNKGMELHEEQHAYISDVM